MEKPKDEEPGVFNTALLVYCTTTHLELNFHYRPIQRHIRPILMFQSANNYINCPIFDSTIQSLHQNNEVPKNSRQWTVYFPVLDFGCFLISRKTCLLFN